MRLVSWSGTDTGKKRDHNEDSFLADDELSLWAVADGMGGHQGGGHASKLALEVMRNEIVGAEGDFRKAAEALVGGGPRRRKVRQTEPIQVMGDEPTMDAELEAGGGNGHARPDGPTEPAMQKIPPAEIVMATAARKAGHAIYDAAQQDMNLQGMGTTLTAIVYDEGKMFYAHAGDSRVYVFRDGKLSQITEDHSWIWEQIKAGAMTEAEARTSKFRHIITRSVGFERDIEVDTGAVSVQAGDCFLLCSDGMSNYVENDELERIMASNWYRRVPRLLIDIANDRGGDDNITVVVVYVGNDAA